MQQLSTSRAKSRKCHASDPDDLAHTLSICLRLSFRAALQVWTPARQISPTTNKEGCNRTWNGSLAGTRLHDVRMTFDFMLLLLPTFLPGCLI